MLGSGNNILPFRLLPYRWASWSLRQSSWDIVTTRVITKESISYNYTYTPNDPPQTRLHPSPRRNPPGVQVSGI